MSAFVALYRGINVGGKNSVPMATLRAMHERLGHHDVKNYIQSGNIVFSARGAVNSIAKKLAMEFTKEFGFAAKLIVVDAKRWQEIVDNNPFGKLAAENPKSVHAGICDGKPDATRLKALLIKTGGNERITIDGEVVYLHAPDGVGTSKFAASMERAAGVPTTVRNWRTVEALAKLIDERHEYGD